MCGQLLLNSLNLYMYQVAVIYMCTRMVVNLTQLYTPLYLVDTLHLDKVRCCEAL